MFAPSKLGFVYTIGLQESGLVTMQLLQMKVQCEHAAVAGERASSSMLLSVLRMSKACASSIQALT